MKDIDVKHLLGLLLVTAAVIACWDTPIVYPLQVLVVFFHEMSHGLAAILTGGKVLEITLAPEQGGSCLTQGGNVLLILSAGYLGSLAWGGALLLLASQTKHDRFTAIGLGIILVTAGVLYVRPILAFGFFFAMGAGVAMVFVGACLSTGVNDFVLKVVGLTSCLYAVVDIKDDILDRPGIKSDAWLLAEHTPGIPAFLWGVLWISAAVLASAALLLRAARKKDPFEALRKLR